MSGQKRPSEAGGPSSGPPEKRRERDGGEDAGPGLSAAAGGSTEEQDIKALQVKNRKLGEALDQRQVIEDELRDRVERLETRQATDDASLLILNRYWNQFDENVKLTVRRCDQSDKEPEKSPATEGQGPRLKPGTPEPDGDSNQERPKDRESCTCHVTLSVHLCSAAGIIGHQGETATSFLATLASSSTEEMEAELQERLDSSQKQVTRVVELYEGLKSTVERLKVEPDSGGGKTKGRLNTLLTNENDRLRQLSEDLTQKHSQMTTESRSLGRAAAKADTRVSELQGLIEELQWDMEKIRRRENRLNARLSEILERVSPAPSCLQAGSIMGKIILQIILFEEMNSELEENRELADNRNSELQKLEQDLASVNHENNNMKLLSRAEGVVKDSAEYRCLQSQFSVLYNESLGLKSQLDETRTRLNTTRTARLRQLEHMENDEVALQRKVRTEVFQLEDTLAQVRKEYEMLRIEFEQTLAANEQAGPINKEMRHLISTLQNHNQQMKGEVVKFKLRLRETQTELTLVSRDMVALCPTPRPQPPPGNAHRSAPPLPPPLCHRSAPPRADRKEDRKESVKKEEREKEKERERSTRGGGGAKEERDKPGSSQSEEASGDRPSVGGVPKRKEVEQLKTVRTELKKAQESQREMKLLLDMYRSAPKEQRDKVQLMAAEKKAKSEVEELRQRLRDLEERERREGKKMADEEALRKIRSVEEQIDILNKKLSIAKQEEDALLSEMDVTGQAFEDMQEQNIRLMQQLREKDDANFKLMSERIKSNQIHKLLKEEKEELADQLLTLKTQVDAQLQVVRKLEEKERLLQGTISTAERELALRTQALDMNKRKAQESALLSEEVRTQLEQVQQRLSLVREEVVENSISREKESFNSRRAQEDISKLRRKIEKAKKPAEKISNGDDILNEEINEYKARLTCPCCNSRVKDAVLTKCFHVFCFECVKTRYDTRQRKCPKCNAAFGANDFHRIYIG
uniref:E3 ubiquitin protein ligase n=1 Tax=Gadus morhua TaxID=8049 RepID=A0A8C4ZU02_GADMO